MESIENSKPKLRMNLEANFKGNTNKLLTELTKEIYSQTTNCPKELKAYLKYGDYLTIMKMKYQPSNNIKNTLNLLEQELGKDGKSFQWFLENYNLNIKK
jgi:hypothetical protein